MCFGFVRMIHGFTSTGLTQTQYVNYSKATNIGYVEEKYIFTGKCTMCRMCSPTLFMQPLNLDFLVQFVCNGFEPGNFETT